MQPKEKCAHHEGLKRYILKHNGIQLDHLLSSAWHRPIHYCCACPYEYDPLVWSALIVYVHMWWINLVITVSRSCLIFCNYSCCTYGARSWDHQTRDRQTRDSQTWDSETQDSETRDRELKKWLIAELTHLNLTKPNLWTLVGCQLPIECPSMKFKGLI